METIVLYPSPGMGHLISMVELGKFILRHHPSFCIAILTPTPSFTTGSTAAYISRVSASVPSITFHHLPAVHVDLESFPSMEAAIFEVLRRSNPHVRRVLESIAAASAVPAFVIDFFCTTSMPIAKELNIPTYYFFTSGACVLAFFFHLPTIHRNTTKSFREMNALLDIPGVPPMPTSEMIKPLLDRDTVDYNSFLEFCFNLPNSSGVIINTFESLEPKPLKAIREGKCSSDSKTPPIFCIGPLLATEDSTGGAVHDCIKWLDKQPSKSVIFLCFGSLGLFSAAQLKEIAIGLEKSGHRFLWAVRPPPPDKTKTVLPLPEPDLDSLLPAGFLDRTADRGFVLKLWAPQLAVLNHGAVGGFMTHCGWNSVLEAVCAGVPMVAWPLYAEQHYNRVVVVQDMKLALRMEEDEEGFVAAEEVERGVRELMDGDSEKGKEVRKAVEEMSAAARAAMGGGGDSAAALGKLVEHWRAGK